MATRTSTALFIECDRRTAAVCWTAITASAVAMVGLGAWLVMKGDVVHRSPLAVLAPLPVGLFLGDLASGLLHWTFDTWFNEQSRFRRAVMIAREHHSHPSHILFYSFRDYVGFSAAPAIVFIAPVAVAVVTLASASGVTVFLAMTMLVILAAMFLASHAHALGHRHARTRAFRLMQRFHFVMSPAVHRLHHSGERTTHYCALNGWANLPCDRLGVWRALERVVVSITGAVPRQHDREWTAQAASATVPPRALPGVAEPHASLTGG